MTKRTYLNGMAVAVRGLVLFTAVFITACADGGGGPAPAVMHTFASGVITAKGSIFVNGIEYDTDAGSITLDNLAGDDSDLLVGMTVELKGYIDPETGLGVAEEVAYTSSIEGTVDVDSIDIVTGTFDVFGVTVQTDLLTVFEGSTGLEGTTPLAEGDRVEVSGMSNGAVILASLVDVQNDSLEDFKVWGTIDSLAVSDFDLILEAGEILNVTFTGSLETGIVDGSVVIVEFGSVPTGSALSTTADKIELKTELEADEGDNAEIEGVVSGFAAGDPASFDVNGLSVSAPAGLTTGVFNGVKVEVEGAWESGILMAVSIDVKEEADLEIMGVVTAVDAAGGTLSVNGVLLIVDVATIFKDDTDTPVEFFGLDDMIAGDYIEAKACADSDTGDFLVLKVERHETGTEAEMNGTVSAINGNLVTVLGVVIDTGPLFGGDPSAFLAGLNIDDPVLLTGTVDGTTVTWDTIELDD